MANQEQLELLKQGVEVWNEWREAHHDEDIDLQGVNLSGSDLQGVNLQNVDLCNANLQSADLRNADLQDAYLQSANLQNVDLRNANLQSTDLQMVNLRNANLEGVGLQSANLKGANLQNAVLCDANLENVDLQNADLERVNLQNVILLEAELQSAVLKDTNLQGADLRDSNLQGTSLQGACLQWANLQDANLKNANLQGANLREVNLWNANMQGADLQRANLQDADLKGADLRGINLTQANLTGVLLARAAKESWIIDAVLCDYVFWDEMPDFMSTEKQQQWKAKLRVPKDRDFRPGEFEALYKDVPTFEYYFEKGLTPIDAILMDQIVQTIDKRYPEFQLKLVSLDSRGQPHAVFTVLQQEQVETAKNQVSLDYEYRIAALEGKQEQMLEFMAKIVNDPKIIHQYQISGGTFMTASKQIIGNNFESGGGNMNIAQDQATANQTNYNIASSSSVEELLQLLAEVQQELPKLSIADDVKNEALHEVKGAEIQAQKPAPDKTKIADKLKNAGNVLKEAGALGAEAVGLGTTIGKAILWCGEHWAF